MSQLLRRGLIAALAPVGLPTANIVVTDDCGEGRAPYAVGSSDSYSGDSRCVVCGNMISARCHRASCRTRAQPRSSFGNRSSASRDQEGKVPNSGATNGAMLVVDPLRQFSGSIRATVATPGPTIRGRIACVSVGINEAGPSSLAEQATALGRRVNAAERRLQGPNVRLDDFALSDAADF
jgi:hypothetical protein